VTAPAQRTALLIDGASLHSAAKALGFDVDFRRLREQFDPGGLLVRAIYYVSTSEGLEPVLRPLLDWLAYNGFTVTEKPVKEFVDDRGYRRVKGNIAVELTVDAIELAPRLDHIVLIAGDGDLRPLVKALQSRGIRVSVVSTTSTDPPMVADQLRRQADEFIELAELRSRIQRDRSERDAAGSAATAVGGGPRLSRLPG